MCARNFRSHVIASADLMIVRLTTVHEKAWIPALALRPKAFGRRVAGMTIGGHPRESGGPPVAASAIFRAVAHARRLTGTQKP